MRTAAWLAWVFVVGGALGLACSSNDASAPPGATGDDGGAGDDDGGADAASAYPAPHPAPPQVKAQANAVMKTPKVVPITFTSDTMAADIDTFVSQVVADTAYWSGSVAEYGVGALTAAAPYHSSDTPAANLTDADVQTWITGKLSTDAKFPKPDGNTLYLIFYPSDVVVSQGGATSCGMGGFMGYHGNIFGSTALTYAVIPRCPPPVSSITEMDALAATASHEIIEAATDPTPFTSPSWGQLDDDHRFWAMVGGGEEIGDVCAPFPGVFSTTPVIKNLVQHVWSNAAAAAGHDPCEPMGIHPYFNTVPVVSDSLAVANSNIGSFNTKGVKIPVGQSKTIELDLFSDAPTSGPWAVSVIDVANEFFGDVPTLSFTLDKSKGQNGDKLQLTIKALAASQLGASPFWIQSDLGTNSTVWIGLVGN